MTARTKSQPPPAAAIGMVVADKYRVESLLGEGGMGMVFAALHLQLGHRVALKVLHSSAVSNREVTERFLREGRALARLQGEHIARVSDVGTLPTGEPYLVMEFLEGQDLSRELLARGALPLSEAVDFIAQACEALAEAHVRGIVHRDLKPANLFLSHKLDGDVSVKVLDFGISKVSPTDGMASEIENITVTSTLVGTPKYMSPEQIQDSRSVDARTDIWGLGTIFYELVTQKRPFAAPSLALVCVKVLHEEVPPPSTLRPDLPPEVDAIIARCLKKDPTERYVSVGELVEALIPIGPPSVRTSAARIQRILMADVRGSGPRLSGADSSGSMPGLIRNAPSTPSMGFGEAQPTSRTPSAVGLDNKEASTLAASLPGYALMTKKDTRKRNVIIGAAGGAFILGVVLFFVLRSPKTETATHPTMPVPTETAMPSSSAAIDNSLAASASAAAQASASAAAMAAASASAKVHTHVVHGGTQTTHTVQSATPKGTGDVLEDRH